MSTAEGQPSGPSGTVEQQGQGLAHRTSRRLWVHHDEAARVTQLLTDFFAPCQHRAARSSEHPAICFCITNPVLQL